MFKRKSIGKQEIKGALVTAPRPLITQQNTNFNCSYFYTVKGSGFFCCSIFFWFGFVCVCFCGLFLILFFLVVVVVSFLFLFLYKPGQVNKHM